MTGESVLDSGLVTRLRERIGGMMPAAREELTELVAIPSVADPAQFPPEECRRAAQWVADACASVGLSEAGLHETPDGSLAVIARRPAPAGAPTVLLYCHYDVQPPLDEAAWSSPPFALTEREGRWYGRGAADCKGSVIAHLLALRALGDDLPVGVTLVAEGSEEQGTAGLEDFVRARPELLRADAVLICDCGNFQLGVPTLTTQLRGAVNAVVSVATMRGAMHSGAFGGPAPDAMTALVGMLSTLHDERGNTTIAGLDGFDAWEGLEYPEAQFRADAGVLDGVRLAGSGSVAEHLWSLPALTILGMDCPPVVGSTAATNPHARARLNLRFPPGYAPEAAFAALADQLRGAAPEGAHVTVELGASGPAFRTRTDGPHFAAMVQALRASYGRDVVTQGQGGSIPLCSTLADTYPDAEIMLFGLCEPESLIHAPNESVSPDELARTALAEALFLSAAPGRAAG